MDHSFMSMTLIHLSEAKMKYLDKTYDLKIEMGQCILISGENGTGKSTLIRLILGFILPDQGKVVRNKAKISYLPEQVNLPPFIKVKAYLEGFARMKKAQVDWDLVDLFGLPIQKSIHELSKGNRQKLGIILTLLGKSDLIIFDEPLTGLDETMKTMFIDQLNYVKSLGIGIIISSHEPQRFLPIIDTHIAL